MGSERAVIGQREQTRSVWLPETKLGRSQLNKRRDILGIKTAPRIYASVGEQEQDRWCRNNLNIKMGRVWKGLKPEILMFSNPLIYR